MVELSLALSVIALVMGLIAYRRTGRLWEIERLLRSVRRKRLEGR